MSFISFKQLKREMEGVHDKVRELERELNEMNEKMNDLIQRERLSNDELQGARTELIKGWNDILRGNHDQIGIKNIGEIDSKVFITEMEKRFSSSYAVIKGVELCSLWQEKLTNPQWYPFQIVEDDKGKPQRLLNEDDISLQELKKKWGQEIHDAVVEALNELHEYNPSGCYAIPELWNFKENRKAKLDEVINYILEAVKDLQHKRCRLEDEKKEKALKMLWKENEELKRSNTDLPAKEQQSHDELRRARKELAKGLIVWQSGKNVSIGIKKMGEIDVIPFKKTCKKRFSKREADYKAADLCYMWQEQIKNPYWHPFRFVGDDKGKLEILLNYDDELLRALKQQWGDEVYNGEMRFTMQ